MLGHFLALRVLHALHKLIRPQGLRCNGQGLRVTYPQFKAFTWPNSQGSKGPIFIRGFKTLRDPQGCIGGYREAILVIRALAVLGGPWKGNLGGTLPRNA